MNWSPANAIVGSYPKKNYSVPIQITGGKQSKKFKDIIKAASTIGQQLGNKSTFGSVQEIGTDGKYVMKTMKFKSSDSSDNLKIFLNEIRVGRMAGINKVGPKIYAWRIIRDDTGTATKGQYIMDNFTRGNATLTAQLATQYIKQFGDSCPPRDHPYFVKLKEVLENFWKITKGYHGDLHMDNIVILTRPDGEIERLMIFDYGGHKKFKSKTGKLTCFDDFIKIIDKEFAQRRNKLKNKGFYPPTSRIPVVFGNRGQARRPNTNMLRGLKPAGAAIKHNFSKSIMSHIHPTNTNRFTGQNLKKMNIAGVSHRQAFMSPNKWNKLVGHNNPRNKLIGKYKLNYPNKSTAQITKAIKETYTNGRPLNVARKNERFFPNMKPSAYARMLHNATNGKANIFVPVNPRNRITRAFPGAKKGFVLGELMNNPNMFNMPSANYRVMVNNFKKHG
jgi:hypothetical protein